MKERLLRWLGFIPSTKFIGTTQAEFERCEELRPDRLGPDEETLMREGWKERDPWRPRNTLG